MSWTVPSGCYFAVYDMYSTIVGWRYYGSGSTVPTLYAPNSAIPDFGSNTSPSFILVDFTNGYIYSSLGTFAVTMNINANNTFTLSATSGIGTSKYVRIIASDYCATKCKLTLTGSTFTFGNGSNIKENFANPTYYVYSMFYSFYGRTDVTSVTLPDKVRDMRYSFYGCTNLQSVSGTLVSLESAYLTFHGCSLLTTPPVFQSVIDVATASTDQWFYYTFENCTSLVTPPSLPENITNLVGCFFGCSSLATAPTIPTTATNINGMFNGCTSLTIAPSIPSAVTAMQNTFKNTAITSAPTIPAGVTTMASCFLNCSNLGGAITINASPTNITDVFTGTTNEIVLFGTGSINSIANNYNNVYVWSLSQTITAVRSTPTTTIDISVDVSRYNVGNLVSLKLYKDNASTPLVVTWSDPTLAVTTNPTTFTTSITGVADGTSTSFTVIATDIYGSANAMTVNVPVAFYTMDVQAGGKEIAFGTTADDDVTNYPEGLFKCAMSFKLKDNLFWVGTRSEYEQAVEDDKMPEHTIVIITDEDTDDYVVEQGTGENWYYRKWNSGKVELWGYFSATYTSYATNSFVIGSSSLTKYPFAITNPIAQATCEKIGTGGGVITYDYRRTDYWSAVAGGINQSVASGQSKVITWQVYVIANWK